MTDKNILYAIERGVADLRREAEQNLVELKGMQEKHDSLLNLYTNEVCANARMRNAFEQILQAIESYRSLAVISVETKAIFDAITGIANKAKG